MFSIFVFDVWAFSVWSAKEKKEGAALSFLLLLLLSSYMCLNILLTFICLLWALFSGMFQWPPLSTTAAPSSAHRSSPVTSVTHTQCVVLGSGFFLFPFQSFAGSAPYFSISSSLKLSRHFLFVQRWWWCQSSHHTTPDQAPQSPVSDSFVLEHTGILTPLMWHCDGLLLSHMHRRWINEWIHAKGLSLEKWKCAPSSSSLFFSPTSKEVSKRFLVNVMWWWGGKFPLAASNHFG